MGEERDDLLQAGEDLVAGGLCVGDQALGIGDLRFHLRLTLLEHLDRHRVDHEGVEQLLAMSLEFGEATALVDDQATARLGRAVQVVTGALAERLDLVAREPHDAPPALDRVLDLDHRQVRQVALRAAGVAADAVEVVVLLRSSFVGGVPETRATPRAAQCALEVVLVPPRPVPRDPPRGEDVFDALPGDLVDQRFVHARVHRPVEQDEPLVVGVRQQSMELAVVDRLADDLAGGAGLEAPLLTSSPGALAGPLHRRAQNQAGPAARAQLRLVGDEAGSGRPMRRHHLTFPTALTIAAVLTGCTSSSSETDAENTAATSSWSTPSPVDELAADHAACTELINTRDSEVRAGSIDANRHLILALISVTPVDAAVQERWVAAMEADLVQLAAERDALTETLQPEHAAELVTAYDVTVDLIHARLEVLSSGGFDDATSLRALDVDALDAGGAYRSAPASWAVGRDCETVLSSPGPDPAHREFVSAAAHTCAAIVDRRRINDYSEHVGRSTELLAAILEGEEAPSDAATTQAIESLATEWRGTYSDLASVPTDNVPDSAAWRRLLEAVDHNAELYESRAAALASGNADEIADSYETRPTVVEGWGSVGLDLRDCRTIT